jgi:aminopeptidase YwaD
VKPNHFAAAALSCALSGCALNQPPGAAPAAAAARTAPSPIVENNVRAHMAFLASDAMNGRASGSRDEWIAATYLASQMQQWGLEPLGDDGGFVQKIEIQRFETAAAPTLTAGGKTFTHGQGIRVINLGAAKASGPLQKYTPGGTVTQGAVLLVPGAGPVTDPNLARAAAILSLEGPKVPPLRMPALAPQIVGTAAAVPRPITVLLSKEVHDGVSSLAEGSILTIEAELKQGTRSQTWNAVGRLTGSDPAAANEAILLSAHLDHIGVRANAAPGADAINNGADDDASGTVAVLELARALALGPRPKRTIVFAFFGSEEAGGFGSRYFADKPVVPLPTIVANLQFEMIGRPDPKVPPHTLWLTGYDRSTLGPSLAKQGAKLVQDPHPDQNFFERSDNIQFARRGVIAHTVSSFGLHKEYHQPGDEIRTIDFPHMTDSIRSMLEPIRWLANSAFKPDWLPGKKP